MSAEEYWKQDKLGRKEDAEFLIKFLLNRVEERSQIGKAKSYVLNIDAQWGDGKTFFLKGLEAQLSYEGYPVAYVNAWADDHAEDPMIAVVSAIDGAIFPLLSSNKKLKTDWSKVRKSASRIARTVGKGVAKQVSKKVIGDAAGAVTEDFGELKNELTGASDLVTKAAGDAIDTFFEERNEIKTFRETLSAILVSLAGRKTSQLPLFVLIDELDRCRPTYAISMLERVKHLFEIDGVVFVIATDSEQLQHSIRSVYGSDFASARYLSRFFDRTFRFRVPSITEFVAKLFAENPLQSAMFFKPYHESIEDLFCDAAKEFSLGLRDIEQAFDLFNSVVTTWAHKARIEPLVLVPLVMLWQKKISYMHTIFSDPSSLEALKADFQTVPKCLSFETFDGQGNTVVDRRALWEVLAATASRCTQNLPDAIRNDGRGGISAWIDNVMINEFRAEHDNMHNVTDPPYSILRQYPEMIRNMQSFEPSRPSQ